MPAGLGLLRVSKYGYVFAHESETDTTTGGQVPGQFFSVLMSPLALKETESLRQRHGLGRGLIQICAPVTLSPSGRDD